MLKRIIEISNPETALRISKGFLCLSNKNISSNHSVTKIPAYDIGAVIFTNSYFTVSGSVFSRLALSGAIICICDHLYQPRAYMLPVSAHHESGSLVQSQADLGENTKRRLWKTIVSTKILHQAQALDHVGMRSERMYRLAGEVEEGDPKNLEAQAARLYWKKLFSNTFKRDRESKDINQYLNYGYAIIRTCVVRSILVHGLHPSLGIHHSNSRNPYKLADDLMEPFRPFMDIAVRNMNIVGGEDINPDQKAFLANQIYTDVTNRTKTTNLWNAINELLDLFVTVITGREVDFAYSVSIVDAVVIDG